jgi:hypothetical protein
MNTTPDPHAQGQADLYEDVAQPNLELSELWQLLQQRARNDVYAAAVRRQLNHLLHPVGGR